jgi:hypothetical protein
VDSAKASGYFCYMKLGLKSTEVRETTAKLRAAILEGLDDGQICERVGLPWSQVEELRRRMLDEDAEIIRHKPTEHTYAEYCLEMRRSMGDLDKVIKDYKAQQNVTGYVAAIKARADLLDRVIKTGQDFGLIERMADGKGYAAGEAIKGMTNPDLRNYIYQEIHVFNTMLVKYGDRKLEDIDPGPLYLPNSTQKFPVAKTRGHSRNKVFGGRQIARDKQ